MTLIFGLLLDAMFGEPRWLWSRIPHPAVMMGACVSWIDRRANNGANRRAKGAEEAPAKARSAASDKPGRSGKNADKPAKDARTSGKEKNDKPARKGK